MMHDPIDSLLYIENADLSGAIVHHIESEFDCDLPQVEKLLDLVLYLRTTISHECLLHDDARTAYSTGVPFVVKKRETYLEPRPDGVDAVCEREVLVPQYPTP